MTDEPTANRNLAMEAVRVTESTALAASRHMGRGDERAADLAAVDAMHHSLKGLHIDGVIRIGEGVSGEVAKLFAGERIGTGEGPQVDVALLPLEGPTIIARGQPNGVSVIAITEPGGFLDVPRIYMDKIAVGSGLPADAVSLERSPTENLHAVAEAKGVGIEEVVVCILDRPRHSDLIGRVRETGARIQLIADGDLSGVVATTWPESGVDIFMGIGGAYEGVLAAAALACVGGQMQARLVFRNDEDRAAAARLGIEDFNRVYTVKDMASGDDVTFAATGVTSGAMLSGVRRRYGASVTHSLVMRSRTGALHFIEAYHDYAKRNGSPGTGD